MDLSINANINLSIIYRADFTDIRPRSDSLVLLKISTKRPENWLIVEGGKVPDV